MEFRKRNGLRPAASALGPQTNHLQHNQTQAEVECDGNGGGTTGRGLDGGRPEPGCAPVGRVTHIDPMLKTRLQSLGVRVIRPEGSGSVEAVCDPGWSRRRGGAGPAEGITILWGEAAITLPCVPATVPSPFSWTESGSGGVIAGEGWAAQARTPQREDFYGRRTRDGAAFGQVALIHGSDCLASTVLQSCSYWNGPQGCAFCGIGTSLREGRTLRRKTPDQLAEVASAALALGVKHVTLTSGSTLSGRAEIRHLAACTRAVVEATGLPVQVQALAPSRADLRMLREAGAASIGLHVESLDFEVLAAVAPVKARLEWQGFLELWHEAVEVFGPWQVVTYVIAGLGECLQTTLRRLAETVAVGVYPHVVPFRPVPGAKLAHLSPPDPALMEQLYRETARLLRDAGGSWRRIQAGCGRCTACSALPDFEEELSLRSLVGSLARCGG